MFDEKNQDRTDALDERLQRLGGKINPSPELKKAAKTGVPLRATGIKYTAGTHIRKFSKAVLLYAACVAILLGGVFLLPKLFGEGGPVATGPSQTTTTAPTPECEHKYIATVSGMQTCTQSQITTSRCQRCGHSYSKTKGALGHDFVDGICTRCGETEEANPAWTLEQFGDPSVIVASLNRMGLTLDQFSPENLPEAQSFLGNDDLHGFFMCYYYNCEKLSPMELYYTFGEKCQLTADELADLTVGGSAESLSMDCYRFTGDEATALLTQYTAVKPTWTDELRPLLLAYGYSYQSATDTFYSFVDPYYLAVNRIIVTGCGTAQSGEWIVFYETQEGDRRMVVLRPDGNSYRFVANCPTDHLYRDGSEQYCEHDQDLATCPYCSCDEHEFADSACTKCGLVCQHEYSNVSGGICILCGTECYHVYNEGTCNVVCTLCGKRQGHNYEEIISTDHICTEGTLTTTICSRCGDRITQISPAKGHSYDSKDVCIVCGEKKKAVTVTDSNITAGSVSLLPGQMVQTYPSLKGDGFTWVDPTMTPYYYNVYTYFGGYTVTDIRVPVYRAEKGSVLTIGVARVENGIITHRIAFYELTADHAMSKEWALFSGLSIEVPEGCTLTFGWMSDTLWYASPVSGHIPGYSHQDDYSGLGSQIPLIFDVYGKKN